MTDMIKIQEQLKSVANEYLRQTAILLDRSMNYCYWVGTYDDSDFDVYDVADLGDITFITFAEMQTIVNRLPHWIEKYGSRKNVAETINDWLEWSIKEENHCDGHARINLRSWLMGLRPSDLKK